MATLTITTDAGQDTRLTAAFSAKLGILNASSTDVKAYLIAHLSDVVRKYEEQQAIIGLTSPAAFTPT